MSPCKGLNGKRIHRVADIAQIDNISINTASYCVGSYQEDQSPPTYWDRSQPVSSAVFEMDAIWCEILANPTEANELLTYSYSVQVFDLRVGVLE